jgi:ABC-2 type transport system permease protein
MQSDTIIGKTNGKGPLAGLRNMLRKENARWWNPKSLLVQAVIWLVLVNSMVVFALFILPNIPISGDMKAQINNSPDAGEAAALSNLTLDMIINMGINIFFSVSSVAMLIGAVIICHDSILKELETGTAAWVMSKPVSRKAFVLSKFMANAIGLVVLVVLLQGAIAYVLCSLKFGGPITVLPFLGGLAVLGLSCLFYAFLAIGIGAFSGSRGATLGLPILIMIGGTIIQQLVPDLGKVTPWALNQIMIMVATTGNIPSAAYMPIVATVLWTAAFVAATLWKFDRIEL